jgi:hypothetical protein
MSTMNTTPNLVNNSDPSSKSYRVIGLFPEAHGAYFLSKVRRRITSTTESDLISENQTQELVLDAVIGAVPSILHGLDVKQNNRRDESDTYSVTFQWSPGQVVRATAVGENATILRDYVALAAKQHTPAGIEDQPEKMKAEAGPEGRIEKFNMTGVALNPYSNRNSTGGSRNTSNWNRNVITADMAMIIRELEVVYANGTRKTVISIPNVAQTGSAGSKIVDDNPFA